MLKLTKNSKVYSMKKKLSKKRLFDEKINKLENIIAEKDATIHGLVQRVTETQFIITR